MKWVSRKLRSKRHLKHHVRSKPSEGNEIVKEDMEINKEHQTAKKDIKIIQYSRKKKEKYKACASAGIQASTDNSKRVVRDSLDVDSKIQP